MANEEEMDFYEAEELDSVKPEEVEIYKDNGVISPNVADTSVVRVKGTESEENTEGRDLESEDLEPEEHEPKYMSMIVGEDDFVVEEESENDEELFNPDERLSMFAESLMSCCVGEGEVVEYARGKLLSFANPRIFRNENYIIFSVLYTYRTKLKHIKIDEEFLRLFLNRNRSLISKSRDYIDINAYGEIDGSVELGYIGGVVKHFKRLCGMTKLTIEEFETCLEKYLIEFKALEARKVYNTGMLILTDGVKIGREYLMGFDDSNNYVRRKMAEIEGLVDMQKGSGFVTMNEVLSEEKDDGKKHVKISDFGKIETLNKAYGGILTGMFYQVLAPPKSGKTKLCARICHTTIVKYGVNVSVWAQEGGIEAWTAQMRAIHFDYTYNYGVELTERKFGVTQEVILRDSFPSDELRQLEMSSKLDLASNSDYGVIDYIDRPFNVETFLEDIDTSVKANNSKLVIIDYLQLIGSAKGMDERARISDAYKKLFVYCKDMNVAVLTPGQYKQEAFNDLLSKGDTSSADMRTSGGGSAEVLRTPDIIFALWATTTDLINNTMKLLSIPNRFYRAFPEIKMLTDLGVCQFISVDN